MFLTFCLRRFPPTRDSAYGPSVKESINGLGASGGLTLAEAFGRPEPAGSSKSKSGSASDRSLPNIQNEARDGLSMAEQFGQGGKTGAGASSSSKGSSGRGGLTMAEQFGGVPGRAPPATTSRGGLTVAEHYGQEPSLSGYESQSGYERSAAPSAPGPEYYNSSAGSNYHRPPPNPVSSSSASRSKGQFAPSGSVPAVPQPSNSNQALPGYPPRSVTRFNPVGILKSNQGSYSKTSPETS